MKYLKSYDSINEELIKKEKVRKWISNLKYFMRREAKETKIAFNILSKIIKNNLKISDSDITEEEIKFLKDHSKDLLKIAPFIIAAPSPIPYVSISLALKKLGIDVLPNKEDLDIPLKYKKESMIYLEGLLDFFKKKEKKNKVPIYDVMECLYDLTDESRITNQLNGSPIEGRFESDDVVFNRKNSLSLANDHDDFMDDILNRDNNFKVRGNSISFRFSYSNKVITDDEVNEILKECISKLNIYNCKMTFFIGWSLDNIYELGRTSLPGGTSGKEWFDFKKMIDTTIVRIPGIYHPFLIRNITVKIESPSGFIV